MRSDRRFHGPVFQDDAITRVAPYESLLDLFTLISFILMLAAFIYAARSAALEKSSSSVVAQVAESGSGVPQTLPHDVLLLVIYRESSTDKLTMLDGATGTESHTSVTVESVARVLNGFASIIERAGSIDVAVYKRKEDVNPAIFLAVSRWLTEDAHKDYKIYFTEDQ